MKHGNNGRLSVWDNAWLIQLIELSMQLTFAKFQCPERALLGPSRGCKRLKLLTQLRIYYHYLLRHYTEWAFKYWEADAIRCMQFRLALILKTQHL